MTGRGRIPTRMGSSADGEPGRRRVPAVHGCRAVEPDPAHEVEFAAALRARYDGPALLALFDRFATGRDPFDRTMRRICLRALVRRMGDGVEIGPGVGLRHPETFEIGDGVYIGEQTLLYGRHDGRCVIGRRCWIGPQCFLDARDLILGDSVGWGPGAKVLGSGHTASPPSVPVIETDLEIAPVRVEDGADIGVGAVLLPGIRIGSGAIVGAGAVVTRSIPPFAVAAGVPARVLRIRNDVERHSPHELEDIR